MPIEGNIRRGIRGKSATRPADGDIATLAARQHGVVARRQLTDLGFGADAIDRRIARGVLHPVHHGVYAVGHRLVSRHGAWTAAVLAAGSDAVLSHRSAAALWGIRETTRTAVDVTCPRRLRRPGIRSRRAVLLADEVTRERGIPVTTPARTLFDLAELLTGQQLERALDEAEIRRLTSPLPLDALIARHPGRRGIAALRRALDKHRRIGETLTRSELEQRFLAFLDAYGLPRPRMNAPLGPYEPDAVWRGAGLVLELDGYATHATRRAFEADRARDRVLQVAGWRVVRITWRQLRDEPGAIAAQLRALLRATVCAPS